MLTRAAARRACPPPPASSLSSASPPPGSSLTVSEGTPAVAAASSSSDEYYSPPTTPPPTRRRGGRRPPAGLGPRGPSASDRVPAAGGSVQRMRWTQAINENVMRAYYGATEGRNNLIIIILIHAKGIRTLATLHNLITYS
ncbi:hypothetical protein HF086_000145 [Spodoptera exigua]|uniref:Uncharacterized protein n=1 Tax=Spodoptera exigua TaxID=7107 RepID=A0A922M771_SPOEX|nr:hypothetical protein HF086_000145 [Spodoptera exigua]